MKHYLVTLTHFRRGNAKLGASDAQIMPVEAALVRYTEGDLMFYDDNDVIVYGVSRGQWATFREVDSDATDQYTLAT